jgi:hypothetical protein
MMRVVAVPLRQFGYVPAGGGSITAPTLAVADDADGTGGTATLTGGDSGATNTIYVQAVNGSLGTSSWTSKGSRTGAGTVSISAAVGFYWVKCESSLDGETVVSNLVYIAFTSGDDAVLEQCLEAVKARIQGLSLSGIVNSSVVIHKSPTDRNVTKPAVVIGPGGAETVEFGPTNSRDDVGYPIFVAILAADNQNQTSDRGTYLLWREKIRRAFHNQRLPGVSQDGVSDILCGVETRDIVAPDWFQAMVFVSAMVIRCRFREPRGI